MVACLEMFMLLVWKSRLLIISTRVSRFQCVTEEHLMEVLSLVSVGAVAVALWSVACMVCIRSWLQSLALPRRKTNGVVEKGLVPLMIVRESAPVFTGTCR